MQLDIEYKGTYDGTYQSYIIKHKSRIVCVIRKELHNPKTAGTSRPRKYKYFANRIKPNTGNSKTKLETLDRSQFPSFNFAWLSKTNLARSCLKGNRDPIETKARVSGL